MNKMTVAEFVQRVRGTNEMFSVVFVKKTNGEIRKMTARMAVKKNVTMNSDPVKRKQEDRDNNVLTCFDMNKVDEGNVRGAFRRINLENLLRVKMQGTEYFYNPVSKMLEAA